MFGAEGDFDTCRFQSIRHMSEPVRRIELFIEIDNNVVERAIRPLTLNRKNALFAGSGGGAEHWAVIASLLETCKLLAIEPHGYLVTSSPVLSMVVNGQPQTRLDDLMPWGLPRYTAAPGSGVRTALTSGRAKAPSRCGARIYPKLRTEPAVDRTCGLDYGCLRLVWRIGVMFHAVASPRRRLSVCSTAAASSISLNGFFTTISSAKGS